MARIQRFLTEPTRLGIVCGVVLITMLLTCGMAGIHNIDNAFNIMVVEIGTGLDMVDTNLFLSLDPTSQYAVGATMLLISIVFLPMVCILTSYGLGRLHDGRKDE